MPKFRRGEHVIWDRVDGVCSFCDTATATFFRMNAAGNAIWELCDGLSTDEIVEQLLTIYSAESAERLSSEVDQFLSRLEQIGLVEREGGA
jgi:hypothetical protein